MTNIITKATIDDALGAINAGKAVGWGGDHEPKIESHPYTAAKPDILVNNAALSELRKNGYIYADFHAWEQPGTGLLTFYNPTTNKQMGLDWSHRFKAQFGENGPLLGSTTLNRLDLIEQIGARDKTKSTYVALTHNRNNLDRLIAPRTDNIVIGNEAFLQHRFMASADEGGYAVKTNKPELSIYREGNFIKFARQNLQKDTFTTSIPANKVKTLRIGDQGAFIDPKTITENPMVIDLPKSIETGKIVKSSTKNVELDLPALHGIRLAEANPSDVIVPAVQNLGSVRQV